MHKTLYNFPRGQLPPLAMPAGAHVIVFVHIACCVTELTVTTPVLGDLA